MRIRCWSGACIGVLAGVGILNSTPSVGQVCVGDCDRNRAVEVSNLVVGVNIALGLQSVTSCQAFANPDGAVDVAQLVAGVRNALEGCPDGVLIIVPAPGELALAGLLTTSILWPDGIDIDSVEILLDGVDVTGQLHAGAGMLVDVGAGSHTLVARADLDGVTHTDEVRFETVALTNPFHCDVLNNAECLLPYPSSRFLVPDPSTATGVRVELPRLGMPVQNGMPIDPGPYGKLDGFSPVGPILMHFPGGAGIVREDLILAFEFVVGSDEAIVADPLAMRAQAFTWLEEQIANGSELFTVESQEDHDCAVLGTLFGREITGKYRAPLTVDPVVDHVTPATLTRDDGGDPLRVGTTETPFTIAIPCIALMEDRPVPACAIGHGLFSTAGEWVGLLTSASNRGMPTPELILAGSDSVGYTFADLPVVATSLSDLNLQPALRDRQLQAQLNGVVWARLLKQGVFNDHPAFQTASGTGVFAGPASELSYWGSSLGGAQTALPLLALSPDVSRALLDTPALAALFWQRSSAFSLFASTVAIADPMQHVLAMTLIGALHLGDAGAYAPHITGDPLPDTNTKQVLLAPARFDSAVSNLGSEFLARTLGVPALRGSVIHDRPGIPDENGPVPSALVAYEVGQFRPEQPHARPVSGSAGEPTAGGQRVRSPPPMDRFGSSYGGDGAPLPPTGWTGREPLQRSL